MKMKIMITIDLAHDLTYEDEEDEDDGEVVV